MHIVTGLSPRYICKNRKGYNESRRNHRDRAVSPGTRSRQEGLACRTRHSILELLQGAHDISARGRAQCGRNVRRPIHSSTSKAMQQEDVSEVRRSGPETPSGRILSGLFTPKSRMGGLCIYLRPAAAAWPLRPRRQIPHQQQRRGECDPSAGHRTSSASAMTRPSARESYTPSSAAVRLTA